MKCEVTRDQLVGFFYAELPAEDHARIEAHVQRCKACAQRLAEIRSTTEILAAWPDEEPDLDLHFGTSAAVPSWKRVFALRPWQRFAVGFAAALAAALVLLSLLNLEANYSDGSLRLKLSLFPRESTAPTLTSDPLTAPVTRKDFLDWEQKSYQMFQGMIREAELRQQRQQNLMLTRLAREMERRREQDLRLVGQGLEAFRLSSQDELRKTNRALQQLMYVASRQGFQPDGLENK